MKRGFNHFRHQHTIRTTGEQHGADGKTKKQRRAERIETEQRIRSLFRKKHQ